MNPMLNTRMIYITKKNRAVQCPAPLLLSNPFDTVRNIYSTRIGCILRFFKQTSR